MQRKPADVVADNNIIGTSPVVAKKLRKVYAFDGENFAHQTDTEFDTERFGDDLEREAFRRNYYAFTNQVGNIKVYSRPFLPRFILYIQNVEADYIIIIEHRHKFVQFMQKYGLVPNILCEILPRDEE